MARNIDYRVEVTVPIYCPDIQKQIIDHFEILWSDNQKAREITPDGQNIKRVTDGEPVRAQYKLYEYVKNML